jgi:hypothetical protein
MRRVLVQGHTRRAPALDFGSVALAALDRYEADPLGARIREADSRAADAGDDRVRAAAEEEARRLRLSQLSALAELMAWRSPSQLALGLDAWAKASELTAGQLDELLAALRAAGEPTTEDAA